MKRIPVLNLVFLFLSMLSFLSCETEAEKVFKPTSLTTSTNLDLLDTVIFSFDIPATEIKTQFVDSTDLGIFSTSGNELTLTIAKYGSDSLVLSHDDYNNDFVVTITSDYNHDLALLGKFGENADLDSAGTFEREIIFYDTGNIQVKTFVDGLKIEKGTWKTENNNLVIDCESIQENTLYFLKTSDYDNDGIDETYYTLNTGIYIKWLELWP